MAGDPYAPDPSLASQLEKLAFQSLSVSFGL